MGRRADTNMESKLVDLYAAISLDGTRLFLAQREICSLEPAVELERTEPPVKGVGWIPFDGRHWPVYCLDGDLDPSAGVPATRRICVLLRVDQGHFGLLCDRLDVIRANRLQPVSLPPVMRCSHTPVQALALFEGTPGCLVSADGLLSFLGYCALLGRTRGNLAPLQAPLLET